MDRVSLIDSKISREYDGKSRKMYKKICLCGKEFWCPKHRLKIRKYCSKECSYFYQKLETNSETLFCRTCGKSFRRLSSRLKNSKHKVYFCSRECKDLGQTIEGGASEIQPSHYGTSTRNYRDKIEIKECVGCMCSFLPLLMVHHKDGNHENSDFENLEVVCHNCHTLRHMKFENGVWTLCYSYITPRELLTGLGTAQGGRFICNE